uniref:NADH dehydrogenase subunit 6 n=1 Tax=Pseudorimula sp. RSIO35641 TaxID=2652779 RepID=A0A5J6VAA4_9VEST|nr:NADH dehydrogenase subunit 6 [Pseudorimula sp. RSIO35641]
MTLLVISGSCLSLFLLMPLMLQPLSLGLCIMLLTVFFCILAGLSSSSWYSYTLFLVFIGGLLVMFAYVSVLAPNSFFVSAKPMLWLLLSFLITTMAITLSTTQYSWTLTGPPESPAMTQKLSSTGMDLVVSNSTSVVVMLGMILLLALLTVVKICFYQQGPLRSHL